MRDVARDRHTAPAPVDLDERTELVVDYSGATHRRGRALSRYARYFALSKTLSLPLTYVPTYWWDQRRNFGDQLTPALLPSLGIAPIHQPPRHAALAGVGSVLEHLPSDYSGVVWGSGLMFDRSIRLPRAEVIAVRGTLSAERLDLTEGFVTGDPGLLLVAKAQKNRTKREPVLIPHYRHQGHALWGKLRSHLGPNTGLIDVRWRPSVVARRIAGASLVITSSLHGLITADANGIPAVWILPEPWGDGGAFKFLDYESNFGWTWERQVSSSAKLDAFARTARLADQERVEHLRNGLVQALSSVPSRGGWQVSATDLVSAAKMQSRRTMCGSAGNQWPAEDVGVIAPR